MTSSPPLLHARQLSRQQPSSDQLLLAPTDFALTAGTQAAVTGPSGSGKSVFLRALALLDPLRSGEVFWHGQAVHGEHIPGYRSHVCYVAQKPALTDGSVEANLRFPFALKVHRSRHFQQDRVARLLRKAGKDDSFLAKQAADLSGGEAQIMALVRILQLEPHVMLLDEPTSALDPASASAVEGLVLDWFGECPHERAYVWVSHDPAQVARISNRHLRMVGGVLQAEDLA
ncbi:ATP-binding cassette domain-containing protein [Pseudomonas sp. dw_358]|uniref:ABC transporter ATP-binding protein n=1 Tax=Pseudomonas sp. dw_358 TaxID=2720083 RepID=UPI001BD3ECC9|nr:ATP-binding cassette domain-containing protein [Pseudomonas sp. dw_358]